jgi:hypothetical protein
MCERWDNSRGLWVKLQETSYEAFVFGFSRELIEKLPPYLFFLVVTIVSWTPWPADRRSLAGPKS